MEPLIYFLTFSILSSFCYNTQADDWPTFQYDNRRLGFSTCEVPDVPHLNWSMEFEGELSSPIVADGKVFVICNRTLYTIDIKEQHILWEFGDCWDSDLAGIIDDMIFVSSDKIYGLDLEKGDIVWETNIGLGVSIVTNQTIYTASQVIIGGMSNTTFYALYRNNASIKWTYNINRQGGGPVYEAFADDILFLAIPTSSFVPGSGTVIALNANNGSQIWRMNFPGWVACMPTIHNGVVYVNTYENKLYALDEYGNGDGTTDVLWTFDIQSYTRSSVAIAYDMIFVGSAKGKFWALDVDPSDGIDEGIKDPEGSEYDVIWQSSAGLIEDGSPVVGDGKVIVYADSGYLFVLNASNGEKIWGKSLPDQQDSTPAIAYDSLFVSAGNTLYVYSVNQKPIANMVYDRLIGNVTTTFHFNATGSYDPDGYLINHIWDFGDGTIDYGENISHAFGDDRIYIVNLTVIDNYGVRGDKSSVIVTIQNLPPIANFSANRTQIIEGENITFNASTSFDPDDMDLNYTWDFGEGNICYGRNVIYDFLEKGTYIVELRVTDDDGESDTYEIIITVSESNNYGNKYTNLWNYIWLSFLIVVIVIIVVFLVSRYKKE